MQQKPSSTNPETQQEALLRATLQEHAPEVVNVEQGWALVVNRLAPLKEQTLQDRRSDFGSLNSGDQPGSRWWRKMPVLVAAILVAILLMGAGIAGGLYFWGGPFGDTGIKQIGDQHLYADIGQAQLVGAVTITVTKGYADKGRTLIAYDVQLPAGMTKDYTGFSVLSFSVTNQNGEEVKGINIECTALPKDGSEMHCLMTLSPFHPTAGTSRFMIAWDITQIVLIPANSPKSEVQTGHWHFQFTLPFYWNNRGSGGQDAQPTRKP